MKKTLTSFLIFLLLFSRASIADDILGNGIFSNFNVALSPAFYVDPVNGNDANNGLSPFMPWQTLAHVAVSTIPPGYDVLLKAGTTFYENLTVPNSGIANKKIYFSKYGFGANPMLDAATQIANGNFSFFQNNTGAATPYTQVNNFSQSDGVTRNYTSVIVPTASQASGTLTITSDATEGLVVVGMSICTQLTTNVCASAPTRITFNSGSNGVTIAAGPNSATSDNFTFPISTGVPILVRQYITQRGFSYRTVSTNYSDANVVDESQVTTPSGGQFTTVSTGCLITSIQGTYSVPVYSTTSVPQYSVSTLTSSNGGNTAVVTTPSAHEMIVGQFVTITGATPTNYNITAIITTVTSPTVFTYTLVSGTSTPASGTITYQIPVVTMFENHIFLQKKASEAGIVAVGQWYWDKSTNTIYVSAWDGSNVNTNVKLYETGHLAFAITDNGKNYIDVSNIDSEESYGSADANGNYTVTGISGMYMTGSFNDFHNMTASHDSRHEFCFYTGAMNDVAEFLTLHDDDQTTDVCSYGGGSGNTPGTTSNNTFQFNNVYKSEAYTNADGLVVTHGNSTGTLYQFNIFNANSVTVPQIQNQFDPLTTETSQFNHYEGVGATGDVVTSGGSGIWTGNLFEQTTNFNFNFKSGSVVQQILGNTIVLPPSSYGLLIASSPNNIVENNALYGEFFINVDTASSVGFVSDYNIHFSPNTFYRYSYQGTQYTSFASWQAISSQDAHSLNVDPQFTNPSADDYSISNTSPAYNAGLSIPGYNSRLPAGFLFGSGQSNVISPSTSIGAYTAPGGMTFNGQVMTFNGKVMTFNGL